MHSCNVGLKQDYKSTKDFDSTILIRFAANGMSSQIPACSHALLHCLTLRILVSTGFQVGALGNQRNAILLIVMLNACGCEFIRAHNKIPNLMAVVDMLELSDCPIPALRCSRKEIRFIRHITATIIVRYNPR